jgi:hypothetical protein
MQQDPKQAVIEYLTNPPAEHRPLLLRQGFVAQAGTIQFLKESSIPHHRVYLVQYENTAGEQRRGIYFISQDEAGSWEKSLNILGPVTHQPTAKEMDTSQPWVDLNTTVSKPFWSGGRVIDHGFDVTRVRLLSRNGLTLEDQVEDGYVLFLSDLNMQAPIEAELYDRSGRLVDKQNVMRALP